MNGKTAELCVNIIKRPKRTKTTTRGIIHHSLFSQRKAISSLRMENLDTIRATHFLLISKNPPPTYIQNPYFLSGDNSCLSNR